MPDLDNGTARVKTGNRVGPVVHLVRPPVGNGLVCDPKIPVDRLQSTDEEVTCKVCLGSREKAGGSNG